MKKFTYKINQYLLEHFPTVWNTKVVWVLLVSLIIHLIFFLFGLVALNDPKLLHENGALYIFFDNGTVFLNVMLSLLILVVWLIYMFKNNAFKEFYPASPLKLFSQFIIYLVIIFFSTTFYYSYNSGLKVYISGAYPDTATSKDVATANNAAVFFSNNIRNYTLDQIRFPDIFSELYCEQRPGAINDSLSHYEFLDFEYQFYSLYTKELSAEERQTGSFYTDTTYSGYVFSTRNDSIETFYYKDTVVDVSKFLKSETPSYFNYSKMFYNKDENYGIYDVVYNDQMYYEDYTESNTYYEQLTYSEKLQQRNKLNYELLKRNNPKEIRKLLNDFLTIADTYQIAHNISTDEWFDLIYHPETFEVKWLIENSPPVDYSIQTETSTLEDFIDAHSTKFYIETPKLRNVFENLDDIKEAPFIGETIHIFIWLAFFLSSVIFMFRTTGLRPLLFTIITVGVLSIFVALLTTLYGYAAIDFSGDAVAFFASYLTLIIGTIILVIPLFFASKLNKTIVAICLNISMAGFVLYLLLIIGLISLYQDEWCRDNYDYVQYEDCFILIKSLGLALSYMLFVVGLVFMYAYMNIIRKWKALPEG